MNIKKNTNSPLKIILIGDSVTKNLTVYEYEDTMIGVDYGIGFPETDDMGVDFLVPDMSYLIKNSHKLKGIFVTHGHADHYAAIPYLLQNLNVPIYAGAYVQGMLKKKLEEVEFKSVRENIKFHLFTPSTEKVDLGAFKVSAFNVNHSVPGSTGIVVETPQGNVVHMADYKVDWSPIIDKPIDIAKMAEYGEKGVICLLSDCLGATHEGYVESESTLNGLFPELFAKYEGRQMLITIISSNVSRMHQIIDAAIKFGRKVVFSGRSIEQSADVSRSVGYLPFSDDVFVDLKKAQDLPQSELVYIIAGCFGQPGSGLDRVSRGEHNHITLEDQGVVVFSSSPSPPGVDLDVENLIANLTTAGAEVVYEGNKQGLHVHGHGVKGDLSIAASVLKPKYFIPIGGRPHQLRAYTEMVSNLGVDAGRVFELGEGDCVEFLDGNAKRGETIPVTDVYIDGTAVDPIVLKDREQLSSDGLFVIVVPVTRKDRKVAGNVDVITRGFVYVKESRELLDNSREMVNTILKKHGGDISDWGAVKSKIEKEIYRFLLKETKRRPIIIVHSIQI